LTWKRKLGVAVPALAWMIVIYVMSAQPTLPTVDVGWLDRALKTAAHFGEYAVLAALLSRFFLASGSPLSKREVLTVVLLATLYALSDEFHQRFVPGRVPDWADVAADAGGAMLAACLLAQRQPAELWRRWDPLL